MNTNERFRRFKDSTGMTFNQLSDLFGVHESVVQKWYYGVNGMASDCHRTLMRLECENLAALSPRLSKETVDAFNAGRKRARRRDVA